MPWKIIPNIKENKRPKIKQDYTIFAPVSRSIINSIGMNAAVKVDRYRHKLVAI